MEKKISTEVAKQELSEIIAFWEMDPNGDDWKDSERRLLLAIEKGRIVLDKDKGLVKMHLVAPIELDNGKVIECADFHEPNGDDLKVFDKYKADEKIAKVLHLASKMTGIELGVIGRMKSRDIATMSAITSIFF